MLAIIAPHRSHARQWIFAYSHRFAESWLTPGMRSVASSIQVVFANLDPRWRELGDGGDIGPRLLQVVAWADDTWMFGKDAGERDAVVRGLEETAARVVGLTLPSG